jgi:hypothetical protein
MPLSRGCRRAVVGQFGREAVEIEATLKVTHYPESWEFDRT